MPKFIYKGLGAEEKKNRLETQMASVYPSDARGEEPYYQILDEDGREEIKKKEARLEGYLAGRKKELKEDLDKIDSEVEFVISPKYETSRNHGERGVTVREIVGKKIKFEKGKPVEIAEDHPLFKKLSNLVKSGSFTVAEQKKAG